MVVLRRIHFTKMHGAGNDFVMVDDRAEDFPVEAIARVAPHGTGIGCEGVILVQNSATADFRMRFFNPDGSEADLCGNGARCVAKFARDIGAVKEDRMRFETMAGTVAAEIVSESTVKISLPDPKDLGEGFINTGVPHAIVEVPDILSADVANEGRRIRFSPEYAPKGTNVDFVSYAPPHSLSIRTYERGVECETGACGTGSVAAALIGVAQHSLSFPVKVMTRHGYEMAVDGEWDGETFSGITLTGPVETVYEGTLRL